MHQAAAVALVLLSVLHLAWGVGFSWPAADGESLALAVIGRRQLPSRAACLFVAAALAVMALAATQAAAGRLVVAVPLVVRGTIGWLRPSLFGAGDQAPFARYNRRLYSPFALLVGLALLWPRA